MDLTIVRAISGGSAVEESTEKGFPRSSTTSFTVTGSTTTYSFNELSHSGFIVVADVGWTICASTQQLKIQTSETVLVNVLFMNYGDGNV